MSLRFAGYAALFDRVDRGGDVIRRGAFAATLKEGREVPLLLEHRPGVRLGTVELLAEDRRGLRVIGRVEADGPVAARVRDGRLDGLSFGYRVRAARSEGRVRALEAVELVEVSLVGAQMQPLARVHAVE